MLQANASCRPAFSSAFAFVPQANASCRPAFSSAFAFVPQANASSMISCCSTACTFDDPDDGADIARREMRRSPVK